MFTEIDENIIEHYKVLYNVALDDLEVPDYSSSIYYNALGIINSFLTHFELNSEGKKVVQNFLNHEDEDIRELVKKVID